MLLAIAGYFARRHAGHDARAGAVRACCRASTRSRASSIGAGLRLGRHRHASARPSRRPYYVAVVPVLRRVARRARRHDARDARGCRARRTAAAVERAPHRPGRAVPARASCSAPTRPFLAGVRGVAFAVVALVWLAWRRGADVEASGDGRGAAPAAEGRRHGDRRRPGPSRSARSPASRSRPCRPTGSCCATRSCRRSTRSSSRARSRGSASTRRTSPRTPLFTVTGLEPGDAIRLADDGRLHGPPLERRRPRRRAVPTAAASASSASTCPSPPLATLGSDATRRGARSTGYDDVWLPTVGYGDDPQPRSTRGTRDRAGDLRYNPAAGTAVLTSGVAEGDALRARRARAGRARDRRAARHARSRASTLPAGRERARRRLGEGRRVRGRGDDPDRAAPRHRDGPEDQRVPQPRARLRRRAVARRARRRPHHRALHAHPDGRRRGAVRLGDGAHGPPPRLPGAGRHGLRARGARGRAGRSRSSATT